jgi:hypothetical protein
MTSTLTAVASHERMDDLSRAARRRTRGPVEARDANVRRPSTPTGQRPVALRVANGEDASALRTLAELDEAPELDGEVLLASLDGEPVAAISLRDGRVLSNPFVATTDAVALLRLRARHLSGGITRRRGWRRLRPRFA